MPVFTIIQKRTSRNLIFTKSYLGLLSFHEIFGVKPPFLLVSKQVPEVACPLMLNNSA